MYQSLKKRLKQIIDSGQASCLSESLIGLEKESLRVAEDGAISQTVHPAALGSALTNPAITTDFSEALIELITPPCDSIKDALCYLDDIQKFVYSKLDNETLWATSMPCVVRDSSSIPIAQYGTSNIGTMKTVYRRGLGYRYGRTMQVIAGVHFNYSVSDSFWDLYQTLQSNTESRQDFISNQYMGLVRNMLRYGWMIPYLFGASPAVCKSFLHGKPTLLSEFNEHTFYEPYATSLRMGDIGYTNAQEDMAGIKADYSSIDAYVKSLQCAIEKPFSAYAEIGVKVDGEYRQLNANILQIENEYYSTVRPKQITQKDEKPTTALRKRGVAYVEIRSLDVNAFDPLGVNEEQLYFLESFVLFCLLQDSPALNQMEMNEVDMNLIQVAHTGRQPGLELTRHDQSIPLKDWAMDLCEGMQDVASLLDEVNHCTSYSKSLKAQVECINDPSKTPSARMLEEMRDRKEGFFHFAQRKSLKYLDYFKSRKLSPERQQYFELMAQTSLAKQLKIEESDTLSFDEYLQNYFSKK
ncbi:MAG: glutamate--cysteine ligase [Gammaproteobacteria bacterium]|nr:glutamate--cysteine ligase [Gammaproteobacteria bacterium]